MVMTAVVGNRFSSCTGWYGYRYLAVGAEHRLGLRDLGQRVPGGFTDPAIEVLTKRPEVRRTLGGQDLAESFEDGHARIARRVAERRRQPPQRVEQRVRRLVAIGFGRATERERRGPDELIVVLLQRLDRGRKSRRALEPHEGFECGGPDVRHRIAGQLSCGFVILECFGRGSRTGANLPDRVLRGLFEERPSGVRSESRERLQRVRRDMPALRVERLLQFLGPARQPLDRIAVLTARRRQEIDGAQENRRLRIVEVAHEFRAVARARRVAREHIQHLVADLKDRVEGEILDRRFEFHALRIEPKRDEPPDLPVRVSPGPHQRVDVVVARRLQRHERQPARAGQVGFIAWRVRRTCSARGGDRRGSGAVQRDDAKHFARLEIDFAFRIAANQRFEAFCRTQRDG